MTRWARKIDKLAQRGDVPGLIEALDDARPAVREAAARALGALHDDIAVEPLGALFARDDPDLEVQMGDAFAAAQALAELGTESAFQSLQTARHSDRNREVAARALCSFNESSQFVLDGLVELVRSGPVSVRGDAIKRAAEFDDPKVLAVLDEALANYSPAVRQFAVADIERRVRSGPDGPRPRLAEPFRMFPSTEDPTPIVTDEVPASIQVRCAAADGQWDWAVGFGPAAVEPLTWLLADGAEGASEAAESAAGALARIGTETASRRLLQISLGNQRKQAVGAARALCGSGRALAPPLVDGLPELARTAHFATVRALVIEQLGDEFGIELLDSALADDAERVRRAAVAAIERRVGSRPEDPRPGTAPVQMPHTAPHPVTTASSPVPAHVQARCAVADSQWSWAASLGPASIKPLSWLIDLDAHDARRREAAAALGRIEDPSVIPLMTARLEQAVAERDDDHAEAAAGVLGAAGDARAISSVGGVLLGTSTSVASRVAAARALVDIGGPESTDVLLTALRHDDDDIVAAVAGSLRGVSDSLVREALGQARDRLRQWCADHDAELQKEQAELLETYMNDDSAGRSTYRLERDEALAAGAGSSTASERAQNALRALDAALDQG